VRLTERFKFALCRVSDIQGVSSASVPRLGLKRFSAKRSVGRGGKFTSFIFVIIDVQLDACSNFYVGGGRHPTIGLRLLVVPSRPQPAHLLEKTHDTVQYY
jgi:hypothetical protein